MSNNIYGYIRVSTKDQNEDRQRIAMQEAGVPQNAIFSDKQSGKNFDREGYHQMDLFSWAETKKAEDQKREEKRKRELQIEEKKKKLDGMMEKVQSRYGENSLRKGMHLPE